MAPTHSWAAGPLYVTMGRSPPPGCPWSEADCASWSWSSRSALRSTLLPYQQYQGGQVPRPLHAFHPVFPWAIDSTAVLDHLLILFSWPGKRWVPRFPLLPQVIEYNTNSFHQGHTFLLLVKATMRNPSRNSRINDVINIIPSWAQVRLCRQQPYFPYSVRFLPGPYAGDYRSLGSWNTLSLFLWFQVMPPPSKKGKKITVWHLFIFKMEANEN